MDTLEQMQFTFDCPVSPWLIAAEAVAVLCVAGLFLGRDVRRLRRRPAAAICALMILSLLMLVGIQLDPKLVHTWPDPRKPTCTLLVDGTRSMLLSDSYSGEDAEWLRQRYRPDDGAPAERPSREAVARLLIGSDPEGWLAALAEDFDLSAHRFGSKVSGLPVTPDAAPFEVDPDAYSTALGDALSSVSEGMTGAPVVLISDGAWNTGKDPASVAAGLGRRRNPVFVVALGNPEPPKDVSVLALRGPETAMLHDQVFLKAEMAAIGFAPGKGLEVELTEDGRRIMLKKVPAPASGRPVVVTFPLTPERSGRHTYAARVESQQGEQDEANNSAETVIEVVERKIRILLADAEPRWEFRFIRNVLERDRAIELKTHLARPRVGPIKGGNYVEKLPTEKKDLLDYDLIIVGDVPRNSLPTAFLRELADWVRFASGGLVVIGGRRGHYRELLGSPVGEILPVKLEGIFNRPVGTSPPFRAQLTRDGLKHLITRLDPDPEVNRMIWGRLAEMRWSADVDGLTQGATALLAHPSRLAGASKMPLMAVQRVGTGKVMFSGIEGTWRWRRAVGDRYHYYFWAQVVRWMVKKHFTAGDSAVSLSISHTECEVGQPVEIEAFCLGPDGYPLASARVTLRASGPGDKVQNISMAGGSDAPLNWGLYRTTFTPKRPGRYEFRPMVSEYGGEPLPATLALQVTRPDLEKVNLAQDAATLKTLAEASGGRYLSISSIGELPSLLAGVVKKRILAAEYSPSRHWAYYVVLAAMLAGAWLIRKRSGLV